MRKTRIICTLGPASSKTEDIEKLINAGMNCARINMSHSSHQTAENLIKNLKKARQNLATPVAIMIDTKGPEIRISTFKDGKIELKAGQNFSLLTTQIQGDENKVSLKYTNLINQIEIGQIIYANNAQIAMKVVNILPDEIVCNVLFGGVLSSNKAINVPNITPEVDFLSQDDKADILLAIKHNVCYIAASFVSSANDVEVLKTFLKENNGQNIKVIAKIENNVGVNNLEKIVEVSHGIMVARGDLGVDIAIESLPLVQKKAVEIAKQYGKMVIIATEMLESMTYSLRPTRAEVSDVAGAVFEIVTATMLSGETAVGVNPENVVKTMSNIQTTTEQAIDYSTKFLTQNLKASSIQDAISKTVCSNAIELNAKLIVVYTSSGETARFVARYKISTPILALTHDEKLYHSLSLCWNTIPYLVNYNAIKTEQHLQDFAKDKALELRLVEKDDILIMNHGRVHQVSTTDTMKIIKV